MVLQTDPSDVMNMLQQMGMNESLELENVSIVFFLINSFVFCFCINYKIILKIMYYMQPPSSMSNIKISIFIYDRLKLNQI